MAADGSRYADLVTRTVTGVGLGLLGLGAVWAGGLLVCRAGCRGRGGHDLGGRASDRGRRDAWVGCQHRRFGWAPGLSCRVDGDPAARDLTCLSDHAWLCRVFSVRVRTPKALALGCGEPGGDAGGLCRRAPEGWWRCCVDPLAPADGRGDGCLRLFRRARDWRAEILALDQPEEDLGGRAGGLARGRGRGRLFHAADTTPARG